jgi:polyhydroxybutyrate depolymerase
MRLVALVVVAVVAARVAYAHWTALPNLRANAPAGKYTLTLESGGFQRSCVVYLPKRVAPRPPLVIVLHGAGGSGAQMLADNGWDGLADAEGFIVGAPDGVPPRANLPASFLANPRLWNAGPNRGRKRTAAIDDVAFLDKLLDELAERVDYDRDRVFVAGHSNGSSMAFRYAAERAERVAAIGCVAGHATLAGAVAPARPVATLHLVGTADPLVPLEGGHTPMPWGGTRVLPNVSEGFARWAEANGCHAAPTVTPVNQDRVERRVFPSTAGAPVEQWRLEGHGHAWPGGATRLSESWNGPNTSKLEATRELWEFFESITR